MNNEKLQLLIEDLTLNHEYCPKETILEAANELRRLHEVNAELLKVLKGVVSDAFDIECGDVILVAPHFADIKAALAKATGESNA